MPIDMDNMLPGFSSQLVATQNAPISSNAGSGGGTDNTYLATALLREEDILDVGFTVTGVGSESSYTVVFQSVGSETKAYTSSPTLVCTEARGTVYRVSDGTISWAATADTEAKRRLKKGDSIQCVVDGTGHASCTIVPFVLMRGAEPLDPIA